MFSSEFSEIFKNTFCYRIPLVAASEELTTTLFDTLVDLSKHVGNKSKKKRKKTRSKLEFYNVALINLRLVIDSLAEWEFECKIS